MWCKPYESLISIIGQLSSSSVKLCAELSSTGDRFLTILCSIVDVNRYTEILCHNFMLRASTVVYTYMRVGYLLSI